MATKANYTSPLSDSGDTLEQNNTSNSLEQQSAVTSGYLVNINGQYITTQDSNKLITTI